MKITLLRAPRRSSTSIPYLGNVASHFVLAAGNGHNEEAMALDRSDLKAHLSLSLKLSSRPIDTHLTLAHILELHDDQLRFLHQLTQAAAGGAGAPRRGGVAGA